MRSFEVSFSSGRPSVVVDAPDEWAARRLAMVRAYGSAPSLVVPHAPDYQGYGLSVTPIG